TCPQKTRDGVLANNIEYRGATLFRHGWRESITSRKAPARSPISLTSPANPLSACERLCYQQRESFDGTHSQTAQACGIGRGASLAKQRDRKSTRLNSSHQIIS